MFPQVPLFPFGHRMISLLLCLIAFTMPALTQPPCDDDPTNGFLTYNGSACPGGTVTITFNFDDDDDEFDIEYSIGSNSFFLDDIEDGHTADHIVSTTAAATLISIYDNDEDCINIINASITIVVFPAPAISIANSTQPSCGQDNGSITAQGSGGTPPYQYSIDGVNFHANGTFSGLGPGIYTVTVVDANGCTTMSSPVTLNSSNAPVVVIASVVEPACGLPNGSITAQGSGGTPPYQFSLDGVNFQSDGIFTTLPAGNYDIMLFDGGGCSVSLTDIQLDDEGAPSPVLNSTSQPNCGQSNGSISASATGGTPPYEYSLNGSNFQSSGIFTGLPSGVYNVVVMDGSGCSASLTDIQLDDGNSPTVKLVGTQPATCEEANGNLTLSATGGSPPYQFSINGIDFQSDGIFLNLPSGHYEAYVLDAAGCGDSLFFVEIENTSASLVPAIVNVQAVTDCPGEETLVSGNLPTGTNGEWSAMDTEVVFDDPASAETVVSAATPGSYVLTWTLSAPNCPAYSSAEVALFVPMPPLAANDGPEEVEAGEGLTLMTSSNDEFEPGATFALLAMPMLGMASIDLFSGELTYTSNAYEVGIDTFSYVLCQAICDGHLCDTAMVFIEIIEMDCSLEAEGNIFPEGITPNGDGYNDYLHFMVIDESTCPFNNAQSELIIFNRWGDRVFEASPYNNDWDGDNLPHGVYYYVLKVHLQQEFVKFGNVTIFRD